jgi:hypothetical protein
VAVGPVPRPSPLTTTPKFPGGCSEIIFLAGMSADWTSATRAGGELDHAPARLFQPALMCSTNRRDNFNNFDERWILKSLFNKEF